MGRRQWKDVNELFNALNQNCNYLVLRNFEGVGNGRFLMDDHPDIDLLCDDSGKLKKILKKVRNPGHYRHSNHFWTRIGADVVEVGIRSVGDGYYDLAWEKNMLDTRVYHPDGFYIMSEENYFYSLVYHAFLQKGSVAQNYKVYFEDAGRKMGFHEITESCLLQNLFLYMRKMNYLVTCPSDITVPMQLDRVPREMLVGRNQWNRRRIICLPIRIMRAVLRRIMK